MLERPNSQDHEVDLRMCCFQAKIIFYPIPFMYVYKHLHLVVKVHCINSARQEFEKTTEFFNWPSSGSKYSRI